MPSMICVTLSPSSPGTSTGLSSRIASTNERTAALLILLDEPSPAGNSAAAERLGAGIVDLAHIAGVDEPLQRLGLAGEAGHEADLQLLLVFLRRRHHFFAFPGVHGERLFH